MSKRKKLDILKRLPNGSVLDVLESFEDEISVRIDGQLFWCTYWPDKRDLDSLEFLIRSLGSAYQRLEEIVENEKKEGA